MKQSNLFINDMLDLELPESSEDILWRACRTVSVREWDGMAILEVPFQAFVKGSFVPDEEVPHKMFQITVRAYGDAVVRISACPEGLMQDGENIMLEWDPSLKAEPLTVVEKLNGWDLQDTSGVLRMRINTGVKPVKKWSSLIATPYESFEAVVYPDGKVPIPFMAHDTFTPVQRESVSLGYVQRNDSLHRWVYSLYASPDEKYAGTGERFAPLNLAGKTLLLENTDGLGCNNRRAYKNVPFYLSSRLYGLLLLTSAHVRLSLADVSTRAAQGVVNDGTLDMVFIGGGSIEQIVFNYRRITGFPRKVPLWSYGTWMSRMTYFSAEETLEVAEKLRSGDFPCDVIHLDTGWFKTDWKCEWEFNPDKFPDPEGYMKEMRRRGFRITLWQHPSVAGDTKHFQTACENRYLAPIENSVSSGSDFGSVRYGGQIDFTNPEAVKWYQGLLENLLIMGAAAIKTDFGEKINPEAKYNSMPYRLLHNLYALLYQKAAFEITEKKTGEGIIWARAGWTGCQRYPVHWGGDCACTWDGMAGSIRGGLHLGVSGFAFWSHDVPGFHGLPDFMNSWPENDLYVRWSQLGVFTSHLRYHGTSPREPYEYPEIAHIVRKWLKLRYALIPYLFDEGNKAVCSGYPIFRAMIFHHQEDPWCWNIDDQFYCGDSLLVAPILNAEGTRKVYLPEGSWTDFWTGEVLRGPVLLKRIETPLERIPVYAVAGSKIRVYPEKVQCTDEMDLDKGVELAFDESYRGLSASLLGSLTGL